MTARYPEPGFTVMQYRAAMRLSVIALTGCFLLAAGCGQSTSSPSAAADQRAADAGAAPAQADDCRVVTRRLLAMAAQDGALTQSDCQFRDETALFMAYPSADDVPQDVMAAAARNGRRWVVGGDRWAAMGYTADLAAGRAFAAAFDGQLITP